MPAINSVAQKLGNWEWQRPKSNFIVYHTKRKYADYVLYTCVYVDETEIVFCWLAFFYSSKVSWSFMCFMTKWYTYLRLLLLDITWLRIRDCRVNMQLRMISLTLYSIEYPHTCRYWIRIHLFSKLYTRIDAGRILATKRRWTATKCVHIEDDDTLGTFVVAQIRTLLLLVFLVMWEMTLLNSETSTAARLKFEYG